MPARPAFACAQLRLAHRIRSYLGPNLLSGTIPASLGNLTGLMSLCVPAYLFIVRETDAFFFYCGSALYYNQLSGTIPSSLGSLTAMTLL